MGLIVLVAAFQWPHFVSASFVDPIFIMFFAVIICGIAIQRFQPLLHRLMLARQSDVQAEILLEQVLSRLGYQVFHNIKRNDLNIDHVIVGPSGVFVIDTRTMSKQWRQAMVAFEDSQVLIAGKAMDHDPIAQAAFASRIVAKILIAFAGCRCKVRGVVLFPSWFVDAQSRPLDVWVMNEKRFLAFLANEPKRLDQPRIFLLSAALEQYVRGLCIRDGHCDKPN